MDINPENPTPEKSGPSRKRTNAQPTDAELALGQATGELLGSQGAIDIIGHMIGAHLTMDKTPIDSLPLSPLEQFLSSDHPSHMTKISDLQDHIDKSKRTVNFFDETDFSGKKIWELVSEKDQQEALDQLHALQDPKSAKEALEGELTSFAGDLWHDYKTSQKGAQDAKINQLSTLISGPDAEEGEESFSPAAKKQLLNAAELGGLIELEKARLVINALTATPKNRPEKEAEARAVMGREFDIVAQQVAHMENLLAKDWIKSNPEEGFVATTEGAALVCPEMQIRMDERGPSKEQLEVLQKAYENVAFRKSSSELSPRANLNQKVALTLASLQVVGEGKKARLCNTFKEIREISKENVSQQDVEEASPDSWKEKLGRMGGRTMNVLKKIGMGKQVGKIAEQWPQMLFMQMLSKSKDHDGNQFGHREQWVNYITGRAGLTHLDQPM